MRRLKYAYPSSFLTLSASTSALTTSWQRGPSVALPATDELEAKLAAAFDAATALTGIDVALVISSDGGSTWDMIASISQRSTDGSTQAIHTFLPAGSGGTEFSDRLITQSHRNADLVAIQARASASSGAAKAGDSISVTLEYSELT